MAARHSLIQALYFTDQRGWIWPHRDKVQRACASVCVCICWCVHSTLARHLHIQSWCWYSSNRVAGRLHKGYTANVLQPYVWAESNVEEFLMPAPLNVRARHWFAMWGVESDLQTWAYFHHLIQVDFIHSPKRVYGQRVTKKKVELRRKMNVTDLITYQTKWHLF